VSATVPTEQTYRSSLTFEDPRTTGRAPLTPFELLLRNLVRAGKVGDSVLTVGAETDRLVDAYEVIFVIVVVLCDFVLSSN
jgi:hypothetical protein